MQDGARRIGPIGTSVRALFGLGFLYFALFDGAFTWGLTWWEAVLGLVVFPAVMVSIGLAAKRFADGPLRATGAGAIVLNLAVLVVLVSVLETRDGAFLFYGARCCLLRGVRCRIARSRLFRTGCSDGMIRSGVRCSRRSIGSRRAARGGRREVGCGATVIGSLRWGQEVIRWSS